MADPNLAAVGSAATVTIKVPNAALNGEAQNRIREGANNYFILVNAETGEEISPAGLRIGQVATILGREPNKVPLTPLQLLADHIFKGNSGDRKDPKVAAFAKANNIKWDPEHPATIVDAQSETWQRSFNPTGLGNFANLGEWANCRWATPCPTNQSMGNIVVKVPAALIPDLEPAFVRSSGPITGGLPPIASVEKVEVVSGKLEQGQRGVQIRITVKDMPLSQYSKVYISGAFTVTNVAVESTTAIIATIDIARNAPLEETVWVESNLRTGVDSVNQIAGGAGGKIIIAPADRAASAAPRPAATRVAPPAPEAPAPAATAEPAAPAKPAAPAPKPAASGRPKLPKECEDLAGNYYKDGSVSGNLQGCITLYGE